MSILTEKAVEKGLELLDTAASLATNEAPKLLQEYLNLMIFDAALGLTPIILVSMAVYYGTKLINTGITLQNEALTDFVKAKQSVPANDKPARYSFDRDIHQANAEVFQLKSFRLMVILGGALFSSWLGYDHVKTIGKVIIAPRVFLIQEGASLIKKGEPVKQ